MLRLRLLTLLNLTQISKQKKGQVGSTLDMQPYSSTSHFESDCPYNIDSTLG